MPRINRRRELLCLGYILIAAIAFRIWILVIDTYNTYLEVVASVITILVMVGIYILIRRPQQANREQGEDEEIEPRDPRDVEIARFLLMTFQQNGGGGGGVGGVGGIGSDTRIGMTPEMIASLLRIPYRAPAPDTAAVEDCSEAKGAVSHGDIEAVLIEKLEANLVAVTNTPNTPSSADFNNETNHTLATYSNHTCSICLDNYVFGDTLIRLPCHHDYHDRCITTWLLHRSTCPLCSRSVLRVPMPELQEIQSSHQPQGAEP